MRGRWSLLFGRGCYRSIACHLRGPQQTIQTTGIHRGRSDWRFTGKLAIDRSADRSDTGLVFINWPKIHWGCLTVVKRYQCKLPKANSEMKFCARQIKARSHRSSARTPSFVEVIIVQRVCRNALHMLQICRCYRIFLWMKNEWMLQFILCAII